MLSSDAAEKQHSFGDSRKHTSFNYGKSRESTPEIVVSHFEVGINQNSSKIDREDCTLKNDEIKHKEITSHKIVS